MIMLIIISEEYNAQKLFASFRHNINGIMLSNPFIIEPNWVEKTILLAIKKGYSPKTKGNDLNLGDLIDALNLKAQTNRIDV